MLYPVWKVCTKYSECGWVPSTFRLPKKKPGNGWLIACPHQAPSNRQEQPSSTQHQKANFILCFAMIKLTVRLHLRKGSWASCGLLSGEAPGARAASDVTGARDRSMETEVEERRRMPRGGGRCEVRGSHSTKNAFTSGSTCGRRQRAGSSTSAA